MSRVRAFLVCALALVLSCHDGDRRSSKPALTVVILIDALRADHVGGYGDRKLTPRLDGLSADATLFENAYSTSTWTRPAIASLFTGTMPTRLGVETKYAALPADVPTLGEHWKSAGLLASGISTNSNAAPLWGFGRGFHEWLVPERVRQHPDRSGKIPADVVTDEALKMLDRSGLGEGDLLWLHYIDPHDPWFSHDGHVDDSVGSRTRLHALDKSVDRNHATEAALRELYGGEVSFVDREIGRLLDGLAARGLYDEALIVVTSDHGEGLWDHVSRGHGEKPFQEQVLVPLLVRFPNSRGVERGGRVRGVSSLLDVLPTVLRGNGIAPDAELEGFDLLLAARRGRTEREEAPFAVNQAGVFYDGRAGVRGKLIRNRAGDADLVGRRHVTTGERNLREINFLYFGAAARRSGSMRRFKTLNAEVLPKDHDPGAIIPAGVSLLVPDVAEDGASVEFFDLVADPSEATPLEAPEWGAAMLERDRRRRNEELADRFFGRELNPSEIDEETARMLAELGYTDD